MNQECWVQGKGIHPGWSGGPIHSLTHILTSRIKNSNRNVSAIIKGSWILLQHSKKGHAIYGQEVLGRKLPLRCTSGCDVLPSLWAIGQQSWMSARVCYTALWLAVMLADFERSWFKSRNVFERSREIENQEEMQTHEERSGSNWGPWTSEVPTKPASVPSLPGF